MAQFPQPPLATPRQQGSISSGDHPTVTPLVRRYVNTAGSSLVASRLGFSALTSRLPWWLKVKTPPVSAGDVGSFPGWENPLEEKMANHSLDFLAWEILWTEELGRLQSETPEHDACSHPLGPRFDLWLGSWNSASHAVWSKRVPFQ